ncbi:MAG: L-aspartate oxidase [Flavobacteriaceae bacterium]
MKTDVLIIGSGIAGLAFAIKLAERKPQTAITIVTKADRFESNTKYAQGGIAAVMDNVHSSFESHINDTLKAGKGFSNLETVRLVVKNAPHRLKELIHWGTPFDKNDDGNWDYGLEGGHSMARILHHKDQTGLALEKALLNRLSRFKNITFKTELFATNLVVKDNCCIGAQFIDTSNKCLTIEAKVTYLASGGSGQVFSKTTNPLIATGDGVAMAARAGAKLENMGFYQFHPTALAVNNSNPVFLISEALRGFGAHLINTKGERFLFKHHRDGELATRDLVTKMIFKELHQVNENKVWLDCRHLDKTALQKHFPNIIAQCKIAGINLFNESIPVAPAAHYQCGGIKVDHKGKTSVKNLFANGECAATGLHGANRLASNSLLEAVVFAHEAALAVAKELPVVQQNKKVLQPEKTSNLKPKADAQKVMSLKKSLQELMYSFYIKNTLDEPLKATVLELELIFKNINKLNYYQASKELYELINIAETARLIVNDILYE